MRMILECGWPAYLVLFLGVFGLVLSVTALGVSVFKPRIGLIVAVVALFASCSVPATGAFGTWQGRSKVESAISGPSVSPETKARIREVGYAEAATCTSLGAGVGVLPGLLALVALGVALVRRKSS